MSEQTYPEFRGRWNDELDVEALIGTFWHRDGPHDAESIKTAALGVDELLHYLARATAPWEGNTLPNASDLYRVVGELRSGLGRLEQVLDQLFDRAGKLAEDPSLYDDRRSEVYPAGMTALAMQRALDTARAALVPLQTGLSDAHRAAGHLGHDR